MLKRLWHFLFGHNFTPFDTVYNPPTKHCTWYSSNVTFESERMELYGFTDITSFCACGKTKVRRLTGKHLKSETDSELAKLREMTGI